MRPLFVCMFVRSHGVSSLTISQPRQLCHIDVAAAENDGDSADAVASDACEVTGQQRCDADASSGLDDLSRYTAVT
jgi:hypothetical protein